MAKKSIRYIENNGADREKEQQKKSDIFFYRTKNVEDLTLQKVHVSTSCRKERVLPVYLFLIVIELCKLYDSYIDDIIIHLLNESIILSFNSNISL